jgi:predicted transcriptional regulator
MVISKLLESSNTRVSLHGLACAGGLDELNGFRSQAEIARELGCTRALVSHYTTAWTDYMSGKDGKFTVTKYRKSEESREVFKRTATDPFTAAKEAAIKKHKQHNNN